MKYFNIYTALIMIGIVYGCSEQSLETYNGNPSIYFVESENNDGTTLSFGYVSAYIQDSVIQIRVRTTGAPASTDRSYSLHVADGSTLLESRDYEFMDKVFAVSAGKMTDTIRIKLLRSDAIKIERLTLNLELEENEFFTRELATWTSGSGESKVTHYFYKRYLRVDDIAGAPWFWDPAQNSGASLYLGYLGTFTAAKFQLMIGRFNLDVDQITAANYRPPVLSLLAWAKGMQAYLNEMTANGTPVLEADGTPMKMGVYAQ